MPDKECLVSVITPSYNQGEFIEDTILSIKNQDYPNIEHIIVDGRSTDNTLDVVKKYEGTYSMRWLSEPDEGQADAINRGFDLATGDIVCWLNSDDIFISTKAVSKIVRLFQGYPEAYVISGSGVYMSKEGQWTQPIRLIKNTTSHLDLRYRDYILQPATFFRSEVIANQLCDTSLTFAFDWDLFIRLDKEHKFLLVDDMIAGYRIHGNNKTVLGGAQRAAEIVEVTRRYLGRRSWQYYRVLLYYFVHKIVGCLPMPVRQVIFGCLPIPVRQFFEM